MDEKEKKMYDSINTIERLAKVVAPGGYREALIIQTDEGKRYVLHECTLIYKLNTELLERACKTGTLNDLVLAYFNQWKLVEEHSKIEYQDRSKLLRGFKDWNCLKKKPWVDTDQQCGYLNLKENCQRASS